MPFVTISSIGGVVGEEGWCLTFGENCLSVAHEDDANVEPRVKGSMPDAKPWIDVSWCPW